MHSLTVILRRFLSPRGRSGIVRESFEGHFGSFGGRSGVVPGSFGGRFGVDGDRSGPFQGHSGVVRDLFGGRSAVIRGSFENFPKILSKNVRKKIRKNLETYFVRNLFYHVVQLCKVHGALRSSKLHEFLGNSTHGEPSDVRQAGRPSVGSIGRAVG